MVQMLLCKNRKIRKQRKHEKMQETGDNNVTLLRNALAVRETPECADCSVGSVRFLQTHSSTITLTATSA